MEKRAQQKAGKLDYNSEKDIQYHNHRQRIQVSDNESGPNDEIRVIPIRKKIQAKNPGSSPEQFQDHNQNIDYVRQYGKANININKKNKIKQVADIYGAD